MTQQKYIISLELYFNSISVHVLSQRPLGNTFTLSTQTISSKTRQERLLALILKNDFKELVKLFKDEFDLMHSPITFSYGPRLRNIITENRHQGGNYGKRKDY